jgi:hypothetical protein
MHGAQLSVELWIRSDIAYRRSYGVRLHGFGHELGFSIGASTSKFVGRALNLRRPGDPAGSYVVAGAGGAIAAGAGGVQLQNANGVILPLSGARVGAEVSVAVGGVTKTMQ